MNIGGWAMRAMPAMWAMCALGAALWIVLQAAPALAEVTRAGACEALPLRGEPVAAAAVLAAVSAPAAWALALERFRGGCRPANYQEAAVAMKAAAEAGHACAAGARGLMLARGWGVPRDVVAARERVHESAAGGCVRAPYWAWLVSRDSGRPTAPSTTRDPLNAGAALGDGHALNALGALEEAEGQRDDARALYQRAAALGNLTAVQNLARLQRHASRHGERAELAELVRQADQGDAQAMYLLARRLHEGDGVAVNAVEALRRYQRAAQLGHAAAREMVDLIHARIGPRGVLRPATLAELSRVELRSDELNKTRGLTQPLEDDDPFAGL